MEEIELCVPVENIIIAVNAVTDVVPLNETIKKKHSRRSTVNN